MLLGEFKSLSIAEGRGEAGWWVVPRELREEELRRRMGMGAVCAEGEALDLLLLLNDIAGGLHRAQRWEERRTRCSSGCCVAVPAQGVPERDAGVGVSSAAATTTAIPIVLDENSLNCL